MGHQHDHRTATAASATRLRLVLGLLIALLSAEVVGGLWAG